MLYSGDGAPIHSILVSPHVTKVAEVEGKVVRMTITLNAEQIARLQEVWANRQTTPQLAGKETMEELLVKVAEYGIMHFEYQRKHNLKNYAEYKAWKQSTK